MMSLDGWADSGAGGRFGGGVAAAFFLLPVVSALLLLLFPLLPLSTTVLPSLQQLQWRCRW